MTFTSRTFFIGIPGVLLTLLACAGAKQVSFTVTRPSLLDTSRVKVIACLGFSGDDLVSGARVEAQLLQQLAASGTYTVVPPTVILTALARYPHKRAEVSDTLAIVVGRAVRADAVLLGSLTSRFTEQYGEEKKFRDFEILTTESLGRRGSTKIKTEAYWEPFVLQTASLTATLRGLSVETGQEIGIDRAESRRAIRIPLPTAVENARTDTVVVKHVGVQLLNLVTAELAKRLADTLSWHAVSITRYVKRGVKGGDAGLTAALKGEWDRARATWERAVHEMPNSPGAWNNLAIAYEQAGRSAEARQAYDRALALQPDDPMIRKNQAGLW